MSIDNYYILNKYIMIIKILQRNFLRKLKNHQTKIIERFENIIQKIFLGYVKMKIYYMHFLKHEIHVFLLKGINQNQRQIYFDDDIKNLIIFNVEDNNEV